ncbi:hypothetical protein K9L05_01890 [Candidatus Babeliales bacterium]|nr:hypothetical protein [Candidatus Babeliales bacterium]
MKKLLLTLIFSSVCLASYAEIDIETNSETDVKTEIENRKIDVKKSSINFFNQNVCFFNSVNSDPVILNFNKDAKKITIIECGCINTKDSSNAKVKEDSDIANLTTIAKTDLFYTINKKTDHVYTGKRKGFGKCLEKALCLNQTNNQNYLFDELKKNTPSCWTLKNAEQAKYLKEYFEKLIIEENFVPTQKTLLLLKIVGDPELKTLDKDVKNFFSKFYEIYTITDKEVIAFFADLEQELYDKCVDIGGSNPEHINEGIRESVLMQTEKNFKKFDGSHLAIASVTFLTTTCFNAEIKKFVSVAQKKLTGKSSIAEVVMG